MSNCLHTFVQYIPICRVCKILSPSAEPGDVLELDDVWSLVAFVTYLLATTFPAKGSKFLLTESKKYVTICKIYFTHTIITYEESLEERCQPSIANAGREKAQRCENRLVEGRLVTNIRLKNQIRRLRFEHEEMSQKELARRAGCTRQTINAIEASKYGPSLELAFRIARVFGVGIEDVFQSEDVETER